MSDLKTGTRGGDVTSRNINVSDSLGVSEHGRVNHYATAIKSTSDFVGCKRQNK